MMYPYRLCKEIRATSYTTVHQKHKSTLVAHPQHEKENDTLLRESATKMFLRQYYIQYYDSVRSSAVLEDGIGIHGFTG